MILDLYRRNEALILGTLSLFGVGVLWQIVVDAGLIDPFFISTPSAVFETAAAQLRDGTLTTNVLASMHSFVLALGLAMSRLRLGHSSGSNIRPRRSRSIRCSSPGSVTGRRLS